MISGRLNYTPEISSGVQWLFRSEINIDLPISELLSLRWRVTNISDNNPAPNVGNNKTTTNVALSASFP